MSLYSIKMRAAKNGRHVSGAERILPSQDAPAAVAALTSRALHHSLGQADFINLKLEEVNENEILHLPVLPVSTLPADSVAGSYAIMKEKLAELGLDNIDGLIELLQTMRPMRGAILYDIAANKRLEPDKERGIRVTYMDAAGGGAVSGGKNHFREALVLATKVVHAPGIVAELCISDDPEYVTGYLASRQHGYVRLTPLKELGSSHGGRVFIFDSRKGDAAKAIEFLEHQKVLVDGLPVEYPAEEPETALAKELERLKEQKLYRSMRTIGSQQSKYVKLNGKKVLMLASNSYLDLAADEKVKQAAADAVLQWGAGSGGSRLTTGTITLHQELEQKLAQLKHTESALLFNTGYMANLGVISALADSESTIFSDEYNHASIIDGCRLSRGYIVVYKHNDMADLERKLAATPCKKGLIVSDAVFSMDGDIVDLPRLVQLGRQYKLLAMIDEAHATGVIGKTGCGTAEYYGYQCQPDITMGTLSKALGAEGGFVCGSRVLIDYLVNKARSFIFSTAQCPATLGAALASLDILAKEPERVAQLQHNVKYFCQCLQSCGVAANSETAIIPIMIGDEGTALKVAEELLAQGYMIPAIRYPTVPQGTARLRAALMATHTENELAAAAKAIVSVINKYKVR